MMHLSSKRQWGDLSFTHFGLPFLFTYYGKCVLLRRSRKVIIMENHLRAADVKLMRQLLIINESIESIKWMMEEKDIITSQGSSLSGSLCSLLESQESSLQGSYTSLHGYSDGMDDISVGSYLDTLADIVPGHSTPDFDQYSGIQQSHEDYQPLCNDSNHHFDEYYCFR
ncbi:leucine rich adaptor protein 1-like isoform X2 [Pseudophryne corroboree]|uniref:leucine rich adaptor protein 1-like isoform X2 n=1 Tax=Pseudophryne corroboree TaxID=495146 RepID=UPI0030814711